jgi:TonB family protein
MTDCRPTSATLLYVSLLLFTARAMPAQDVPSSPGEDQSKPREEYADMLMRVRNGDMAIDFRAFRAAGALMSGPHASILETGERAAFRNIAAKGDWAGALDSANRALERNYASPIAQYDAMAACQALGKTEEAAAHEKILNALLDSIRQSGDGKNPETAYFVVTVQEEYIFLNRVLHARATSQTWVRKDGHFYDRLSVPDSTTSQIQYLWFNADFDARSDPGAIGATKDGVLAATTMARSGTAPQSTAPGPAANAEVLNPPNAGRGVVRSGTFHIAEEGISNTAAWRVMYDLSGTYTVTPSEVLVTLGTGSARTIHSAAAPPVLHSLRLGVCYQMSTDSRFGMFPGADAGQELSLNDVGLKDGDVFKFPSSTFRIPRPNRTPAQNWLCSSLSEQGGSYYPAHDAGRPELIPSSSVGTHIRVRNRSDVDFKDVVVRGKPYGDIAAGAASDYQTWESAHRRIEAVSLMAASFPMAIRPIDFVGEPHLGQGYFTYVLTIEEGRLKIRSEEDTEANPSPSGPGTAAVPAEQAKVCDGKKLVASIPHDVFVALGSAIKEQNFEEAVRIASQPESGLKVASLSRNKNSGRILSYLIVNQAGCTVTTMSHIDENRARPLLAQSDFASPNTQAASEDPPGKPGAYRAGGGVTSPVPLYRPEPDYPEEARRAKRQGTVVLYVEVDPTGHPRNIKVLRRLGHGLDEKATEALEKWRFRPGYKDGKPVTVASTVEVNFRLQ